MPAYTSMLSMGGLYSLIPLVHVYSKYWFTTFASSRLFIDGFDACLSNRLTYTDASGLVIQDVYRSLPIITWNFF